MRPVRQNSDKSSNLSISRSRRGRVQPKLSPQRERRGLSAGRSFQSTVTAGWFGGVGAGGWAAASAAAWEGSRVLGLAFSTDVAEGGSWVFGLALSSDVACVLAVGLAVATFRIWGVGGEERARELRSQRAR